ncbi:hypothetical protein BM1_10515 [Bipolaris maydis]|nr:hypothetical protein BM1_10515 [Bipolaris maydis]
MSASLGQQGASPNNTPTFSGQELISNLNVCNILGNDGVTRAWTDGHQFNNSTPPPAEWRREGVDYSPSYLANVGLWGHKESDQIAADITTLVEYLCSSWDAFKAIYDKENRQDQNALVEAIAQNVYDLWGANPGWSSHHQETYKDAVKRMVKYKITTHKPPVTKSSSNKPNNSTEHISSEYLQSNIRNMMPEREAANGNQNNIQIEDMVLIVSRDANWDGNNMNIHKFSRSIRSFDGWQTKDMSKAVNKWLRSRPISFNPNKEEIHLLCPNAFYGQVVTTNINWIRPALLEEHFNNAVNLKMKIMPNHTIQTFHPIRASRDIAAKEEKTSMFFANRPFKTCVSGLFECNPPTEATWKETQHFFKLLPSCESDANTFQVQGIKQPIHLHHLMLLTQARKMVQDIPVMFLADGAGLDPVKSALLLLWGQNAPCIMDAKTSVGTATGGNGGIHRHGDAAPGCTHPSLIICSTQHSFNEWKEKFDATFDSTCPLTPELVMLRNPKDAKTSLTHTTRIPTPIDEPQPYSTPQTRKVYLEMRRGGVGADGLSKHVKAAYPGTQFQAVFLDHRVPVKHQSSTPEDDFIIIDDSNTHGPGGSMNSLNQPNFHPLKVYILHGLWWEETQELLPYLELIKDQFAHQTKFAETSGLSTMPNNTINELEALIQKTRQSKNSHNVLYDKYRCKTYNKNLRQLLSKLSIRRFHDTIIPFDNGRNSVIQLLQIPISIVKRLTYADRQMEVCHENFSAAREAFEWMENPESGETSSIPSITRQRLMDMLTTTQVIATMPSLAELFPDGYFQTWAAATDISKELHHQQAICLSFNLSNAETEKNQFAEDDWLFKRVAGITKQDAKINWLITTIESIVQSIPDPHSGSVNDTLEKIVVLVQANFVCRIIASIIKGRFEHEGITLLTSNMDASLQAKIIHEFQTPTKDDALVDDEDVTMANNLVPAMPANNAAPRILVAVQDAISPAIDLTCANHMIFLEPGLFPSDEVRISKQMHAASQMRRCFLYRPMVEGLQIEDMTRCAEKREWFFKRLRKLRD